MHVLVCLVCTVCAADTDAVHLWTLHPAIHRLTQSQSYRRRTAGKHQSVTYFVSNFFKNNSLWFTYSALTLLIGRQEEHLACKN